MRIFTIQFVFKSGPGGPRNSVVNANFHIVRSSHFLSREYDRNEVAGGIPPEPATFFKWSLRRKSSGAYGLK